MSCINKYSTLWVVYFVKSPLAAITAWSLLGYVCISLAHLDLGDFLPFFLADLLKLCQVGWRASVNSNLQVFPQILSGIQVWVLTGPLKEFHTFLFWSRSIVALAVCLGSLSCWNVNLHRSLRSFALSSSLSSMICLYLAPFIVHSILTSLTVPATEKHPHSMMLPPPCFVVGMVLCGWWAVLGFHQT